MCAPGREQHDRSQRGRLLTGALLPGYGVIGPVIQPNCVVWQAVNDTSMQPRRIGKVGPFYTDGTCDGSGGGTLRDDAPQIIESPHRPGG